MGFGQQFSKWFDQFLFPQQRMNILGVPYAWQHLVLSILFYVSHSGSFRGHCHQIPWILSHELSLELTLATAYDLSVSSPMSLSSLSPEDQNHKSSLCKILQCFFTTIKSKVLQGFLDFVLSTSLKWNLPHCPIYLTETLTSSNSLQLDSLI